MLRDTGCGSRWGQGCAHASIIARSLVFLHLVLSSHYMENKSETNNTMDSSMGKDVRVGILNRDAQRQSRLSAFALGPGS